MGFEEFGLTLNEGKVYETLVKFGKLGSGELSRESGVSYSKIYNILDSLIEKGLVNLIPEKTKKFTPSNPESLIKLIEGKQKELEKAKQKAKEMKRFYDIKEKNPVILKIGKKGFYKIVEELKEAQKYNYSVKYTSEYKKDFTKTYRKVKKTGIDLRTLTRYDKETEKDVRKWMKIRKNIRKISNEGVAMSIIDDEQVMVSLIKSNMTLLIKDKPFAKIMKEMFLKMYKDSEKIN